VHASGEGPGWLSEDYQLGKFEDGFVLPAETASLDRVGLICYVSTGDAQALSVGTRHAMIYGWMWVSIYEVTKDDSDWNRMSKAAFTGDQTSPDLGNRKLLRWLIGPVSSVAQIPSSESLPWED
jgi:hypothetical protein